MTGATAVGFSTLGELFTEAGERFPDRALCGRTDTERLSFAQLAGRARALATGFASLGVGSGTPVSVLLSSGPELLQVIGAVAAAGAVLVPLPPPVAAGAAYRDRLSQVLADSEARYAVVDDRYAADLALLFPGVTTLGFSDLRALAGDGGRAAALPDVGPDDLAIIQYTSGSTSEPRGVALSHRNVVAGIRAILDGTAVTADDVVCHWLPLSHDMGLFSTLAAVAAGAEISIVPPPVFIKDPEGWLRRVADLRATILVGPNFGYRHLMEAVAPEDVADYDLSAIRLMLNGAEPIEAALLADFATHFAGSGLARTAMTPCYGLAEATLAVTMAELDMPAAVDWVERDLLADTGQARPVAPHRVGARGVVDCGVPVTGVEVRVAADGVSLPERTVGDIEIRGVPVMRSYHRQGVPVADAAGWCPTGDLGYLVGDHLHVTGRRKEMLIVGGRNHYPQDVEAAVRRVPGLHRGRAVAVVLPAASDGGAPERIAVLAETDSRHPAEPLAAEIRRVSADVLDGAGVDVVLLRPGALLRTTSGKFQRLLMRRQLLTGGLGGILTHLPAGGYPAHGSGGEPCPR